MAFTAVRSTERKATLFFPMFVFGFIIVFCLLVWFGQKTLELELLMRWQEGRRRREQERTTLFQQSPTWLQKRIEKEKEGERATITDLAPKAE